MIKTPTIEQIKNFYPISQSIENDKLEEVTKFVLNIVFLQMFGYENSQRIAKETIPDSESDTFLGFNKFLALCVAYQIIRDPLISTNFGAKVMNRPNTINPTNNEKAITLIQLEEAISIHQIEAIKILNSNNCQNTPNWGGYFSYKVNKL